MNKFSNCFSWYGNC